MKRILACLTLAALASCASKSNSAADASAAARSAAPAPTRQIVPGSQEDLEQNVGHRVYFAFDQYTLSPQAQETLRKQADWMKKYPTVRIQISGNADERGTSEYNMALGARRAEASRQYLVASGVAASRLTTFSYGKERPICLRSEEQCWSQNRNATSMIAAGQTT